MKVNLIYVIIFLTSVFVASVSQIILKKSANKTYENKLQENITSPAMYFIWFHLRWIW